MARGRNDDCASRFCKDIAIFERDINRRTLQSIQHGSERRICGKALWRRIFHRSELAFNVRNFNRISIDRGASSLLERM